MKLKTLASAVSLALGLAPGLIAQGINKTTRVKKQTALGAAGTGAGGQVLRRETSVFEMSKEKFESTEIVSHQQSTGSRHGLHAVSGKIAGLLSPRTYQLFMASACRKDFTAGVSTGAQTNMTAASTGATTGTFTRAAGSFFTDGFKVGDVVRWTGWAGGSATNNNAHNMLITALTATVMTVVTVDGTAVVADASGDSVTCTVAGRKTWVPMTGHTDDIFSFEEWYADVQLSELFIDNKLNTMAVELPASGNAKVNFDFVGLRRDRFVAQQMTSPTAETTTDVLAAVTGVLVVNGTQLLNCTGVSINVEENVTADGPVVGSDYSPDISRGKVTVTGEFTAYFENATMQALYEAETTLTLMVVCAASDQPGAEFVSFIMTRVKLDGDAPDDGEKGIVRTYPFTAEINMAGGTGTAFDQSILAIQDSQAT